MLNLDPQMRLAFLANAAKRIKEIGHKEHLQNNLLDFLKGGWKYIDPATFMDGWHLQAIAEHLQAVTDGQITRLCINVPPRSSKSSLVSVAWPAWTWAQEKLGPLSGPHVQFLFASYAQSLALRDSVKTRRLIESPWYQENWGDRFKMTGDVNTKVRFENNKGGYRLATSVEGTLTGEGGAIIVCDDPHNAVEMESDLVRKSTLSWWDESLSTRLNDPATGAYVVIMQRLHQEDLTGHVMTKESENWTWLMLPMEYESERHCTTYVQGAKFWDDPRTEDGELLCDTRFSRGVVEDLKRRLGPYAAAGQLQQSPTPRGGGIIKDEWWKRWNSTNFPQFSFVLASLDTAYTEKEENDPSALTIWGVFEENDNPKVMLIYGWEDRLPIKELVDKVTWTCSKGPIPGIPLKLADGHFLQKVPRFRVDRLLIEAKAAGHSVAQELHRLHSFNDQFGVELVNIGKSTNRGGGDKISRLYSVQHLWAEGLIYMPFVEPYGYKWANEIVDQISIFPRGPHDDFVDTASMAIRYLRDSGMLRRQVEYDLDETQRIAYRSRSRALYPV